jgi:hypothetical protein
VRSSPTLAALSAVLLAGSSALLAVGSTTAAAAGTATQCPRQSQAPLLPRRPSGGLLRGDIDGDGQPDRVSIHYAKRAPTSCGFFLIVETRHGAYSLRVPESYKTRDMPVSQWPWREPYVAMIVQLTHGAQIVLARERGAAVVNVSLYGIVAGKLALLHFGPAPYQDELPLFGTVGTGASNVRCTRRGPLTVLSQGPRSATGKRWFFSRSNYQLTGDRLSLTHTHTITGTATHINATAERSGFNALPFTGCIIARGRRL